MTYDPLQIRRRCLTANADALGATEWASRLLGGSNTNAPIYRFISRPQSWSADWSSTPPPDNAFEIRWFNAHGEVRWVRSTAGGRIAVVLVGDSATSLETEGLDEREPARLIAALQRHYRCWGNTISANSGGAGGFTATLFESRIGSLRLPVESAPERETPVEIVAWELLDQDDSGNVRVVDEILRAIRPVGVEHEGKS